MKDLDLKDLHLKDLHLKDLHLKDLVQPLPNRSTPDLITVALRQAIGYGLFEAGQSLRQDKIAGQFGVSRIPVREALRQLEAEGLVVFHPNRGAMVSVLSAADVEEIYDIRVALETMALKLAMPQLRELDLTQAASLLKAIQQTTQPTTQPAEWVDLNRQFYTALYAPANRPRLLNLITIQAVNIDRYLRRQPVSPTAQAARLAEHQQLLDACWQRDTASAVQILRLHLEQSAAALVIYLELTTP